MNQQETNKAKLLDGFTSVITNKRSRSLIFLVITFLLILLANGLLPLVSGQAHYTAEAKEFTYGEYLSLKSANDLYDLTYVSKLKIERYIALYRDAHPDISPEEILTIEPPTDMKVNVYTKFFFQSAWWYIDTTISMLSAVLLFYALFNYLITRDKDTREDHINGENTIRQLNEKYLDPDTFEEWIEKDFNRERKIKQHIRNVKYSLKKLEQKTPFKIRRRFKEYFEHLKDVPLDNLLPVVYVKMDNKERKYLERKEDLLIKLQDDYIKSYVIDNDVPNFKNIQAGFVYSGINVEGIVQDEYSTIQSDAAKIRKSLISKILVSFAITVSFASVLTILAVNVAEQNPLWVIITIIMKIVPLVLQIYFAINYTNEFMEQHLLPNLKFRENIAMRYLAEMKRRGILTQPIVIQKINVRGKE